MLCFAFPLNSFDMRILHPKNQFGQSLLSKDDTQVSSLQVNKQMTSEEAEEITLTSADVDDIEKWELENAFVTVEGS